MSRIRGIENKAQKDSLAQVGDYNAVGSKKAEVSGQAPAHIKEDADKKQMSELVSKLPQLGSAFELHRKIGEGTFSSVYLGSLRAHAHLPERERRWFAVKHLVPTAHPARVEHELRCMRDMGGQDNVIGVDLCLRNMDTVVFVMPYIPHRRFPEYVGGMDAAALRRYMRALLTALRRVHSFGVIHRDVKPSNFLYDEVSQRYLLVDFGLAQRITPLPPPSARVSVQRPLAERNPSASEPAPNVAERGPSAHEPSTTSEAAATPAAPPVLKRPREDDGSPPEAKRVALDLTTRLDKSSVRVKNDPPATKPQIRNTPSKPLIHLKNPPPSSKPLPAGGAGAGGCVCAGAGGVCARCAARPAARAPRAGTQGFRPPEVLLKYPHQTTAVDMWACGVVLASALCARYPLLRAAGDAAALAELAALLGAQPLQRVALQLGRRLVLSRSQRGLCLRKLCARFRSPAPPPAPAPAPPCRSCLLPRPHCLCRDPNKPAEAISPGSTAGFPDAAFSLAARLLDPDPRTRISAAQALQHPFFHDQ